MRATGKALHCLPYDILYQIVSEIDCLDYIHLSRTNRTLHSLLGNDLLAKRSAENSVRYSKEVQLAVARKSTFRDAIGRLYDIKAAVASASPYSVAVLAYAAAFIYQDGVLSYYYANEIRILNVHQADRMEQVLDVRYALRRIIPTFCGDEAQGSAVQLSLLYYKAGVLAILVVIGDSSRWLILLDVTPHNCNQPERHKQGRVKFVQQLQCTRRLFVRHNGVHLFYGYHQTFGASTDPQWAVQWVDLTKVTKHDDELLSVPTILDKFAGTDVGQNVCFEIFDNHLYAVTNTTESDEEELNWKSYYEWVRIAPNSGLRRAKLQRMLRRAHKEGPINDTWSEMSLQLDEATGKPMIYECRREWRFGGSANVRTYYISELATVSEDQSKTITREAEHTTPPPDTQLISAAPFPYPVITGGAGPSNITFAASASAAPSGEKPNPFSERPPERIEKYSHSEYDEATSDRRDFILAKTKHRAYNPSAGAFVDLINDPEPSASVGAVQDRLRLRICSRKRKSPFGEDGLLTKRIKEDRKEAYIPYSEERYVNNGIKLWPLDESDQDLVDLLCPARRAANVHAVADERSLIYSVDTDEPNKQAIILISFDPQIRLASMRSKKQKAPEVGVEAKKSSLGIDLPRIREIEDTPKVLLTNKQSTTQRHKSVLTKPAMYLSIDRGYWFDRSPNDISR